MADWSLARPAPDIIGNALNAFQAGQKTAATRQAGNALQAGDTTGAANAYFSQGMNEEGLELQNQGLQLERQGMQDQRLAAQDQRQQAQFTAEEKDRNRDDLLREAEALRLAPEDQRPTIYTQRAVPMLQKLGIPQKDIDRVLIDGKLTDKELDSFIVQMGGEPPKMQGVNLGGGGYGSFDPNARDPNAAFQVLREPSAAKAPNGFEWDEAGDLRYIPGGPADPRVAGARASATRAPKAAKAGGGGSGGSSVGRSLGSGAEPAW